jgi:hypothetical protein
MNEVYFLKTAYPLINYRGYFKDEEKIKDKIHDIMNQSFFHLVKSWEKKKKMKWEKPVHKIISKKDIIRSIHLLKIPNENKAFKLFPVGKLSNKIK